VVGYSKILTTQAQVILRSPSYSEFPLGQDGFPMTAMPMRTRNVMKRLRMMTTKMTTIGKAKTKTDKDENNRQEVLRNTDDEQDLNDQEILEEEGFGEL
jgi:hypothetical protein